MYFIPAFSPACLDQFSGPADSQCILRHVFRDCRPGSNIGTCPYLNGRNKVSIAPNKRTIPYRSHLLFFSIKIDKDHAAADVNILAQLCIAPVWQANFAPAEELSDSQRGAGGFGSTGKL